MRLGNIIEGDGLERLKAKIARQEKREAMVKRDRENNKLRRAGKTIRYKRED